MKIHGCIKKAGKALDRADRAAILDPLPMHVKALGEEAGSLKAVDDLLVDLELERESIVLRIEDQGGEVKAPKVEKKKEVEPEPVEVVEPEPAVELPEEKPIEEKTIAEVLAERPEMLPATERLDLEQKDVSAVFKTKEFKRLFPDGTIPVLPYVKSPVAWEYAKGWLDAKEGFAPFPMDYQRKGEGENRGFNPMDAYMTGYLGAKYGIAKDIRQFEQIFANRGALEESQYLVSLVPEEVAPLDLTPEPTAAEAAVTEQKVKAAEQEEVPVEAGAGDLFAGERPADMFPGTTLETADQLPEEAPTDSGTTEAEKPKSIVRSYHMDEWTALGIPEEAVETAGITGDLQRGTPEIAMTKVQAAMGGGVLNPVVEHVGDLSNRASPMHGFGWGREAALGKAENQLKALRHPYGFEKELEGNIKSNAEFRKVPEEEVRSKLNAALDVYANAHKELPVHNEVQRLARDAAIAVGEKRFDDAADLLERFIALADNEVSYISAFKGERVAPVQEEAETTYFKGDLAEYTGKKETLHGAEWEEVRLLDGHLKGELRSVPAREGVAPAEAKPEQTAPEKELAELQTEYDRVTIERSLPYPEQKKIAEARGDEYKAYREFTLEDQKRRRKRIQVLKSEVEGTTSRFTLDDEVAPAESKPVWTEPNQAQKILNMLGGTADVYNLAGSRNVDTRVKLMKLLTGKDKIPKAKAGVTALKTELHSMFNVEADTPRNREIDLLAKLEAAAQADETPSFDRVVPEDNFYSALVETINKAEGMPKKGSAALKRWLDGQQRKGNLKKEERDWMGVDEWLDLQKTVTRAELQAFVRDNQVAVEEVMKGSELTDLEWAEKQYAAVGASFATEEQMEAYRGDPETITAVRDWVVDEKDKTKFADQTLPGGENYRELLLTLPQSGGFTVVSHPDGVGWAIRNADGTYITNGPETVTPGKVRMWDSKGLAENEGLRVHDTERYRGGHYDEPNVLAHIRFNERAGPNGEKILFIEEIQSDWHQKGREKGYNTPEKKYRLRNTKEGSTGGRWTSNREEVEQWFRKAQNHPQAAYIDIQEETVSRSNIPNAPFKKTWPMLAMKRMIRYAAENGFDSVAWTTGEQQAERYSLEKQVDYIEVAPSDENKSVYLLAKDNTDIAFTVNAEGIVTESSDTGTNLGVDGKSLSDVVGKEMAKKIMGVTEETKFRGDDLKIGGQGMKGFYDKMLVNNTNKFVKKWGGRVGVSSIKTSSAEDFTPAMAKAHGVSDFTETVHSLEITDSMRKAAESGFPMFDSLFGKKTKGLSKAAGKTTHATIQLESAIQRFTGHVVEQGTYQQVEAPKDVAEAVDAVKRVFGKRVVFFREAKKIPFRFNGTTLPRFPKTLYINVDSQHPFMGVVGHELLHSLRVQYPALYDQLADRVRAHLKETGFIGFTQKLNRVMKDRRLTKDKMFEEMVANVVGEAFLDPAFVASLAAKDKTLFRKVLDAIIEILQSFQAKAQSQDMGSSKYFNDLQSLVAQVQGMLTEFNAQGKKTTTALNDNQMAGILGEDPAYSIARNRTGGISISEAEEAVRNKLGQKLSQRFEFYETLSDIPTTIAKGARQLITRAGLVEGFVVGKKAYLITKNISSPERAAWVAWHEMWHRGARIHYSAQFNRALRKAGSNNVVRRIAAAIADQNADLSPMGAIEEALAELNAAMRTNNYDQIKSQYGVTVPPGMRTGWRSAVQGWMDAIKRVMNATRAYLMDTEVGQASNMTDLQVSNMVRGVKLDVSGNIDSPLFSIRTGAEMPQPHQEERWVEAGKGYTPQKLKEYVKDHIDDVVQGFSRHYKHLPTTPEFADVTEQLRKAESAPEAARDSVIRMMKLVTQDMGVGDIDLFTRKVVLDDLSYEITQDHELPMDLTPEDVHETLARIDALLVDRPDIMEAVETRRIMVRNIAAKLVEAGVLTENEILNPYYYRHQILDYMHAESRYGMQRGSIRTPKRASRKGSLKDINVNYLEVEFEWLNKALIDIEMATTLTHIKEGKHNVHDDAVTAAREANIAAFEAILDADLAENGYEVLSKDGKRVLRVTSPLNEENKSYSRRIAMGIAGIKEGLQERTFDIPAKYVDIADEIANDERTRNPLFYEFLGWLADNGQEGSGGAKMVFSAINQRKAWKRSLIGEAYVNTQNMDELVYAGFAPEGYVTWQPDKGRLLYTAQSLSDHVVSKMVGQMAEGAEGLTAADAEFMINSVKNILAVGGPKYQMIIPAELAATLDSLHDEHMSGLISAAFRESLTAWKRWQLISPWRFLKYNINNFSGDIDAVFAIGPKILLKFPKAVAELTNVMYRGATPSAAFNEAVRRGVFASGLSAQEIKQIDEMAEFRNVLHKGKVDFSLAGAKEIVRRLKNTPLGIFRAMQKFTWYRENMMRYAAYLHYEEMLANGGELKALDYGASRPEIIDEIVDYKDRAAMLARKTVGDYGDISHFGTTMRQKVYPFWSWVEVNTSRYWRLGTNAMEHNLMAGLKTGTLVGAALGVRATTYIGLRTVAMYTAVTLWNNLRYGDEEDELTTTQRARLHINIGRSSDGKVRTIRFQGALSDFLDWVGFGDVSDTIMEVERGRASYKDVLEAAAVAPVNKFVGGLTPVVKVPVELIRGESWWPDVFHPRRIRDKWRYAAQLWAVEHEYDLLFNKPSPGYLSSLGQIAWRETDPGQAAYTQIRSAAYDWRERTTGKSGSSSFSTPRSEALYEYKLAQRYGDEGAEEVAREKVIELSDNMADALKAMRNYRKRSKPLAMLNAKERREFEATLDEREHEKLSVAHDWWDDTFNN